MKLTILIPIKRGASSALRLSWRFGFHATFEGTTFGAHAEHIDGDEFFENGLGVEVPFTAHLCTDARGSGNLDSPWVSLLAHFFFTSHHLAIAIVAVQNHSICLSPARRMKVLPVTDSSKNQVPLAEVP